MDVADLRGANAKFTRRFEKIEGWLAEDGREPGQSDLDEMDALWDRAKAEERGEGWRQIDSAAWQRVLQRAAQSAAARSGGSLTQLLPDFCMHLLIKQARRGTLNNNYCHLLLRCWAAKAA